MPKLKPNAFIDVRSSRSATRIVLLVVVPVLVISLVGLGAKARFAPAANTAGQDTGGPQGQASIETELVTIRPYGFVPAAITRPAGDFILVIDDRGQKSQDLALALSRVQSDKPKEKIKDVDFKRGKVNWIDRFNLPPGEYILTEANHPEWQCKITLTPR